MKSHGLRSHVLYPTWTRQRHRCNSDKHVHYDRYKGRGIKFSKEFDDFTIWLEYIQSLDNCQKEGYSLDRKDNDGHYERGNLRWANKSTQAQNTSMAKNNTTGYRGVTKTTSNKTNPYASRITVNGKIKFLGNRKTALECAKLFNDYVIANKLEHTLNEI